MDMNEQSEELKQLALIRGNLYQSVKDMLQQYHHLSRVVASLTDQEVAVAPIADPDLELLVMDIFGIIPSYYDKAQAAEIADAIQAYVERKLEQRL